MEITKGTTDLPRVGEVGLDVAGAVSVPDYLLMDMSDSYGPTALSQNLKGTQPTILSDTEFKLELIMSTTIESIKVLQ